MNNEKAQNFKRNHKAPISRLKLERERHGLSQSELAERIGTTQANVSRWERGTTIPGPYFRRSLGDLFEKSLEELGLFTDEKVDGPGNQEKSPDSTALAALPQPPTFPIFNVPYRKNPFFTGREDILTSLYTVLKRNKTAALTQAQAISGLGGVGKTQIAVEYAYRYRDQYQAILWVTASSRDTLIANFITLAALLNLQEQHEQDPDIVVRAVNRWLAKHENWLLILDNVDDLEMVADFLMQEAGNYLFTTRLQALGAIAQSIEVEKMGIDEGVTFLLRRTKILTPEAPLYQSKQEYQEQAAKIVNELDGLPLALDQAGAYIEETGCGFSTYLDLYQTHRKELLQRRGRLPVDHPEPVATTWSLSFEKIEKKNPAAADMLRLLTFLNPEDIPEEIIIKGATELGSRVGPVASDPLRMNETLELLLSYSLLRRISEAKFLRIHRLVQATIKDGMEISQQRLWAERAIRAINKAFPEVKLQTWAACLRCLPHTQISETYIKEYELAFPDAIRLFNRAANYLSTHAQYVQAESLLKQSLAMCKQIFSPINLESATTLSDLGVVHLIQGKYQQSMPLLQKSLEIREQALGREHPDTATSLNNLGLLYNAQGKYPLAEEFFQQALHIRQAVLEPEHPDIAKSMNNLAELYTTQGKYEQAELLYLQAQNSQEKTLGLSHPDVAKTLNNLALLYRSKGEYSRAEEYYQQALSIQENVLGPNHPDVAATLHNMARLYRAMGEYTNAEPLYQRALNMREEVFGLDHPLVAESTYGLAKLYNSQGHYLQAEEFAQRALRIQEKRLGTNHPDIANTLGMLAIIYQAQHKLAEAKKLNKRALRIREYTSDESHPHIAFLSNNLAEIYLTERKYHKAEPLIARSLAIRAQILGNEHPYMAYSLSNLAENYFLQGDYIQAETFFKQALTIREHNLGSDHPRIASTYSSLARLYTALGRYEEAEPLYCKAIALRKQALGPEHPIVITLLEQYSALLRAMGKEKEACETEEHIRTIKVKQVNPASE